MGQRSTDEVYVYGSNLAGRFVSDTQHFALRWHHASAKICDGVSGDSYAIAIQDRNLKPLPNDIIARNIERFLAYARANPGSDFYVPRFTLEHRDLAERDIAEYFDAAPANCHLPGVWRQQQHPGVMRLFLLVRWPELRALDYELFYVWLHKYAKRLLAAAAEGGLWCLADAQAEQRIGTWAAKMGVPFHPLQADTTKYGQHALEIACSRLLTECTEILAMESRSASVEPIINMARHLGLGTRLIKKYAPPVTNTSKAQTKPPRVPPVVHGNPLRQPSPEDLEIYDPAGVYGSTGGAAPIRLMRAEPKVDEHPFGRILAYLPDPA